MKLKSYFSASVEAAMDLARRELGEEALLVNAKPSTGAARSLGAFEVVFGVVPPSAQPIDPLAAERMRGVAAGSGAIDFPPPLPLERFVPDLPAKSELHSVPSGGSSAAAVHDRFSHDLASLRRDMERMGQALRVAATEKLAGQVQAPELYNALIAAEVEPELARRVADGTPLADTFQVDATVGRKRTARGVVVLVGPPGAGKTTTLVKLAARYGLAARRPSHIISTDVYRIAAADQLRVLSSILGIGCTVVETAHALEQVLEEHRGKDYIFVDTPGLGRGEMDEAMDLARLLASHPETDTHLVLPASMKAADLTRMIDQYNVFEPAKLLFTRLDETERIGALLSEAVRWALPISFLSTGQQIPDDLEPATKEGLLARVLQMAEAPRPVSAATDKNSKTFAAGVGV